MKKLFLPLALCNVFNGYCCVSCNKQVQEAIRDNIYPNLMGMLSAFIILAVVIAALAMLSTKKYRARLGSSPDIKELASVPLTSTAMVLGIGLGGFADGIVLHQILQWHEMLSNKLPATTVVNKSVNMFWDGIFHAFTLITTLIGVYLFWRLLKKININRSGNLLVGGMLFGWGLFNLVEGIINHQILELHNVRELSPDKDLWNYGFLGFGVLLLLIGGLLIRRGQKKAFSESI